MTSEMLELIQKYMAATGTRDHFVFDDAARWFIANGYALPAEETQKLWKRLLKAELKKSSIVTRSHGNIRRWYALPSGARVAGLESNEEQREMWVDMEVASWSARQAVLTSISKSYRKAGAKYLALCDYCNETRKKGDPLHQAQFSFTEEELRESDDDETESDVA